MTKADSVIESCKPALVIALYQPKAGKNAEIDTLARKPFPILKGHGLAPERAPFIGRSTDGTIIDQGVF